jgi:hypothetical protein
MSLSAAAGRWPSQIEAPQQQIIFEPLVHASVQGLEPIRVYELGIDDRRLAGERRQGGGQMWKAFGPVGAVARVDRDRAAGWICMR